jgi:hypothetical protein
MPLPEGAQIAAFMLACCVVPVLFGVKRFSYASSSALVRHPIVVGLSVIGIIVAIVWPTLAVVGGSMGVPLAQAAVHSLAASGFRRVTSSELEDIPLQGYVYDGKFGHALVGFVVYSAAFIVSCVYVGLVVVIALLAN